MSVRCSAKQIADFVVLWGMAGTFPEHCEYAEDARCLKSLDLIISTLDVFVEAFCFSFENIYRKYKVDFPLSEEKFIEFLKPRCLLLTKENNCFNFMLVCAFVYDIIHSFSHYNKCFHLVKVASKCLAAILNNRYKKIFKTDSDWEKLMSFCIKIHGLVYPSEKIYESNNNQLVGAKSDKMEASFPTKSQGLDGWSVEKYATNDNSNNDSNTKMSGKETSESLKNDLTTKTKEGELEALCSLEFPSSTDVPLSLQLTDEGSPRKSEYEEKMADKNTRENKNCVTNLSSLDLSNEFNNTVGENMSISGNKVDTEKLDQIIGFKKNVAISFEDYSAIRKMIERLEDLCNLELLSTVAKHALQLKDEDLSMKEVENKEKIFDAHDARKDNEKDFSTNITSLTESAKKIDNIDSKKTAFDSIKDSEKLAKITGFKKNLILSFDDYLAIKKVIERLEDLCNMGITSTGPSHALQLKIEDFSLKEAEDKEKTHDVNDAKKGGKKVCATEMTDSSLPELTKEFSDKINEKAAINNNNKANEKLHELTGYKNNFTLSFEDYLVIKKVTERLEHLYNLGLPTNASYTIQLEDANSSPKENKEKIYNEKDNEKGCVRDVVDLSVSNLAQDITNIAIKNKDEGTEKLVQLIEYTKNLTLSFGKDLAVKKVPKSLHLYNLEPDFSIGASNTFQMEDEDISPDAESERKENVGENKTRDSNENVIGSLVPNLAHKLTKISIEEKAIKENVKEKPGEKIDYRKKLTFPFSEDSSARNPTKKCESIASNDIPHTVKEVEFSSKTESEDNEEPFNIRCMSADKIRARITDNPQQLSEIMNLLKKCEEDIEPNLFSPDENNMLINDSDEDEGEMEVSGDTSKSSSVRDQIIFESSIKTIVFVQNMKVAHSIKKIFSEDDHSDDETSPKASGGEHPHEMSDEAAFMYSNRIFESKDPRCSLCAGETINLLDTCVRDFAAKYSNNSHVTDLFKFDFYEDSE
ncbi:unnamed protein product [Larinioides sclopetarius]|uniref:Uncharacterized protein n=1 Tax=Larinioides sclopetarius TaxID=280406 RepID=A0AAV2ALD1_9ARAC